MFGNEVIIDREDKKIIIDCIRRINTVLGKYPWSSNHDVHTVTSMSRAKSAANEADTWINLLESN